MAILASALFTPLGCGGGKGGGGTGGGTGGGSGAVAGTGGDVMGTGGGVGGTGGGGGGTGGGGGGTGGSVGGISGTGGAGITCAGHDIDVPVATVSGSFTVGGAAVPSTTEGARIVLYAPHDATTGNFAALGYTGQGTYTARVVPGIYDVLYRGTNDSIHPINPNFRLRTGVVIPAGSSSLDIDVPVATVTGSFTVGGAAVTSTSSFASIVLRSAMAGDGTELATTGRSTYTTRLVPGTYDVYYSDVASDRTSSTVPFNYNARLRTGVVIPPGSSSLDIDVPVATVTGSLTVGGAAVPSTIRSARISLRNPTNGGVADIGYTGNGTYAARIIPGTYDVYYSNETQDPLSTIPFNLSARIRTGVVIPAGSSSLDIDVPVATVTGSVTVGGSAFSSTTEFAVIGLQNAAKSDSAIIGEVGQSTYTARLVPGTYDVYYSASGAGATLPTTDRAIIRTGVVIPPGSSSLDIDVPVATVTGSLTVGGVAVPSTSNDGRIYLKSATNGMAHIGYTGQTTYTIRLVPGTYDVDYAFSGITGSPLPISASRIRTGVVIPPGSSSLDIDVPVTTVTGSFTVGGLAVPSTNNDGSFTLRHATTGTLATLGYTGQTTYTARLVPGTYEVRYTNRIPNPALPVNSNAKLRCFVVP